MTEKVREEESEKRQCEWMNLSRGYGVPYREAEEKTDQLRWVREAEPVSP